MAKGVKNQRIFLMLNREDAGFGTALEPSGYVKIEVRDGKGKLSALVQDLREDRLVYRLYLIWSGEGILYPVSVGSIPLKKNKGEINWEFIPENVANTGVSIENFNIAAVLAENEGGANNTLKCPLAAYKDKKLAWREKLKEVLYTVKADVQPSEKKAAKIPEPEAEPEVFKAPQNEEKAGVPDISAIEEEAINKWNSEEKDNPDAGAAEVEESQIKTPEEPEFPDINPSAEENQVPQEEEYPVEGQQETAKGDEKPNGAVEAGNPEDNDYQNNCTYKKEEACPFQPEEGVSPCSHCQMNPGKLEEIPGGAPNNNIDVLIKNMNQYFEKSDPFNSKRKDYQWWKVNSPVYLNNILYQCNIKTPLLFNPKVMMAHFKYRHLIAGVYTDTEKKRECIVCGIPGVYNIDERPFGELCRWVQIEGNKPRYGAFGYWLVYIDFKTGKFLNFA